MKHILKDHFITDLKGLVELPVADEVTTQAAIPSDTVAVRLGAIFIHRASARIAGL